MDLLLADRVILPRNSVCLLLSSSPFAVDRKKRIRRGLPVEPPSCDLSAPVGNLLDRHGLHCCAGARATWMPGFSKNRCASARSPSNLRGLIETNGLADRVPRGPDLSRSDPPRGPARGEEYQLEHRGRWSTARTSRGGQLAPRPCRKPRPEPIGFADVAMAAQQDDLVKRWTELAPPPASGNWRAESCNRTPSGAQRKNKPSCRPRACVLVLVGGAFSTTKPAR